MGKAFFTLVLLVCAVAVKAEPFSTQPSPYEANSVLIAQTRIDLLVSARLQQLRIQPANICSDEVFIRRVYLDAIGTLPTEQEVREFLDSRDLNKRRALIEKLLAREEFVDCWTTKWCDVLRVKAEFPINLWPNAAQAYHHWIRASLKQNKPYDRFVRELLTANGSNFRDAAVNFYRATQNKEPQGIAQTVALTFMGTRADKWPKEKLDGLTAFFTQIGFKSTAEWKEEIVFWDAGKTNALTSGVFPDGTVVKFPADRDPREVFADWLITPKNPWFARNIVNRVWSWLLGQGIIQEPDDIRPDNPPSNPELLAYLEQEFINSRYDLKHLYRLILNSRTYQLSSIPKSNRLDAAANFAVYPLRRLDAEVLIDAIDQITGTHEKYTSSIPEPFTFIPENQRSIALPDGSISSAFLELFGRPSRDTGYESERNNRPTASQKLHLLNSSHIERKIEDSEKIRALIRSQNKSGDILNSLYLMILSRYPTPQERKVLRNYTQSVNPMGRDWGEAKSGDRISSDAVVDIVWALINNPEFLYRH